MSLPNGTLLGAILMKFNANGDTLWTKWTGYYGGFNKVISDGNGLFYALMAFEDMATNSNKWAIYLFNESGQSLGMFPIADAQNATLLDMEFRHGYIWISGQKTPSLFYPQVTGSFDFLLKKLRPDGTEVFSLVYNGNQAASRGRMMEFMPNGNILFSGSAGRDLCSFEIDTAGNQIAYKSYFQNPLNGGWQNASVKQMADGNRLVVGNRNTSPSSYYLAKHDTNGTRIWGGISQGGVGVSLLFSDSSLVFHFANNTPPTSRIRRLSSDSVPLSSFNFMAPGMLQSYKTIHDVYYEEDQSGIAVGEIYPTNGSPVNLYIAKFGNLGIPFDPTSAQALENLKTDAAPLPFPNPGGDHLKFTLLAGPGRVSFTDALGKTVWEGVYHPEKGIHTRSFRPGVYHYRLERKGKVWGGKWVKE